MDFFTCIGNGKRHILFQKINTERNDDGTFAVEVIFFMNFQEDYDDFTERNGGFGFK